MAEVDNTPVQCAAMERQSTEGNVEDILRGLIDRMYIEEEFLSAGVFDWADKRLSEEMKCEWRHCLTMFFKHLDTLADTMGISKKDIYQTVLQGARDTIRQMPRELTLWQFLLQESRHEFASLVAADTPDATLAYATRSTDAVLSTEDVDTLFVPERPVGSEVGCDATSGIDPPKTPSKNRIGRYSQNCALKLRELKSPEKREQYADLIKRYEARKKRNSNPATSRRKIKKMCRHVSQKFKILAPEGMNGTLWVNHTGRGLSKGQSFHCNVQTTDGSHYHDVMDGKGEGFAKWANMSEATSYVKEMIDSGHGRGFSFDPERTAPIMVDRSNLDLSYDEVNPSQPTLRDRNRAEVTQRLLTMIETEANKIMLMRHRELILSARGQHPGAFVDVHLARLPPAISFDADLQNQWGLGLFLRIRDGSSLRRTQVTNAGVLMKRRGGAELGRELLKAIDQGHIRVAVSNPFDSEERVEGPVIPVQGKE